MPGGNGMDSSGVPLVFRESLRWVPPTLTSGGGLRRGGLSAPPVVGLLDASISTMSKRKAIAYPGLHALTTGSVGSSMNEQRRAGGSGEIIP